MPRITGEFAQRIGPARIPVRVASVMTHYMTHKMDELDIPSIPEFIEMIADTGAGLYGCKDERGSGAGNAWSRP